MYCQNCGKQIPDNSNFCINCGTATNSPNAGAYSAPNYQQPNGYNPNFGYQNPNYNYQNAYNYAPPHNSYTYVAPAPKSIVQILSDRMQINGIIWLVIGILQCILAVINIIYLPVYAIIMALIGTFNIIQSKRDIDYSKKVLSHPYDIVKKFAPLSNAVATLIYNLLFGGIIGVAGSIYYFTIRSFVMNNQGQFAKIEREFLEKR